MCVLCQSTETSVNNVFLQCDNCSLFYHSNCIRISGIEAKVVAKFICKACNYGQSIKLTYKTSDMIKNDINTENISKSIMNQEIKKLQRMIIKLEKDLYPNMVHNPNIPSLEPINTPIVPNKQVYDVTLADKFAQAVFDNATTLGDILKFQWQKHLSINQRIKMLKVWLSGPMPNDDKAAVDIR